MTIQQTTSSAKADRDALRQRSGAANRLPHAAGRGIFAALDLGSINCRLLIAHGADSGFEVIDSFSRIVRLGQGLRDGGDLNPQARQRTIEALKVCAQKLKTYDITAFRAIATQACRQSDNGDLFLMDVYDQTGLDIEVIDNREEARLAIGGCMPLLDAKIPFALAFDIGGGSTEVIWMSVHQDGEGHTTSEIIDMVSMPVGVENLGENIGPHSITRQTYNDYVKAIQDHLKGFSKKHDIESKLDQGLVQMLGTSGTVTTLSGIHLGLNYYDRSQVDGSWLKQSDISQISDMLRQKERVDRACVPCVGECRADVVLAGCVILEAICACWPLSGLRVADRGVREGILLDLIAENPKTSL